MILADTQSRRFALHTAHTTYELAADADGRLLHLYYGPRCSDPAPLPADLHPDPGCWPDQLPQEWPASGLGDNRAPFFVPQFADGTEAPDLRFAAAEVLPGKYSLPGLPAFWAGSETGETLKVTLTDPAGLTVYLYYGVFEDCDLITRAAELENTGTKPLTLHGVPSAVVDFAHKDLDFITFDGEWAAERTPHRAPLRPGVQSVGSVGGIPLHYHTPFAVLCAPDADEVGGEAWGAALVYSGNYRLQAELNAAGVRLALGIEPYHFHWILAPGERFTAPEAAFVYSVGGFGGLRRCFHNAIRQHLLRAPWRDMARPLPVLLNSWEACYFAFDEEKLLELAAAGKRAGADLFVVDDGWFKGRNDTTSSLGDWTADPAKLPGGIPGLCKKINALGMALGLWVEPEAVSPDSDLCRAHPDWALHIPGRETLAIRHQYTLDFSRANVRENIWQQLTAVLDSAPIRYLKWDMNRSLASVYSVALPAARQGEVYHRYVLGVYELQERLLARYPDLLLENCASGGARFDCGMLYYSPQIWTSDNTDARDRMLIQYGTSFLCPPCVMGAHVSAVPNHITHRETSLAARAALALTGTFGYELDLTTFDEKALAELAEWSAFYRAHGALLRGGDLYWLCPPDAEKRGSAWAIAAPDGSEAVVFAVGEVLDGRGLPLSFADTQADYTAPDRGQTFAGATLRTAGLPLPACAGELPGFVLWLRKEETAKEKA